MKPHACVDCAASPTPPATPRPAEHGGPRSRRCATHHRAHKAAQRARTADSRVRRVYGLGVGEYDAVYAHQGGRCAICQRATGARKRLAVDHDHDTGAPRGLLCGPCNHFLIGRYGPDALRRALDYLADPPVAQLRRQVAA